MPDRLFLGLPRNTIFISLRNARHFVASPRNLGDGATAIRRDANTGSGVGTSFGTIPLGNTVQGHMNDTQLSSQNSRLTLEATGKTGTADLTGSLEVDFLGSAPNG